MYSTECDRENDLSAASTWPAVHPAHPPNSTYLTIWAGSAVARQRSLMPHQERIVRNVGKLGTPISPVWTLQRSSSRERRAQSAPRRETPTNATAPRVGSVCLSVYFSLRVLIFLQRTLNMALRSTTSINVAYWRRNRSRCLPKQRLRLKQEGHDTGLHHWSLAFETSLPRMCVTFSVFIAVNSKSTTRQHRPTRIPNTLIIFSSYFSV